MKKSLIVSMLTFCLSGSINRSFALEGFPGLSDLTAISGAQEYITIYSSYARALSKYYGRAVALNPHLTMPFGEDNLGSFPTIYLGLGFGSALSNTKAIKAESDPEVTSGAVPAVLPSLAMAINMGMAINKKWDLRLSFLPVVNLSLPKADGVSSKISMGQAKAKVGYHILPAGLMKTGLTLSGFTTWSKGSLTIITDEQSTSNRSFTADSGAVGTVTSFTYSVSSKAAWHYGSIGAEVKLWYDLLFVFPYIGYGASLQGGKFTTDVNLNGNIAIDVMGTPFASTATPAISESAHIPVLQQRIFLGLEFKIFLVRLGLEVHSDVTNQLLGISLGTAFQF